jgi:hypothetical protein
MARTMISPARSCNSRAHKLEVRAQVAYHRVRRGDVSPRAPARRRPTERHCDMAKGEEKKNPKNKAKLSVKEKKAKKKEKAAAKK